jgi:uncharacterized protein
VIDLTAAQQNLVQQIARQLAPAHRVCAYGSRARRSARKYSDLDLLFIGPQPLSTGQLGDLAESFDESNLPFRVDIVDAASATPEFLKLIEADLQPLN